MSHSWHDLRSAFTKVGSVYYEVIFKARVVFFLCSRFSVLVNLIFKVVWNLGLILAVTWLKSRELKIEQNTKNLKDLIKWIVVLVQVHECLATHKKWAKSIFQARSSRPLLQRLPLKNGTELETRVYTKPTNTGLLLHFQSHVDKRCKIGLLKTMLHRAYVLSCTTEAFNEKVPSYALYSTNLITQLAS